MCLKKKKNNLKLSLSRSIRKIACSPVFRDLIGSQCEWFTHIMLSILRGCKHTLENSACHVTRGLLYLRVIEIVSCFIFSEYFTETVDVYVESRLISTWGIGIKYIVFSYSLCAYVCYSWLDDSISDLSAFEHRVIN